MSAQKVLMPMVDHGYDGQVDDVFKFSLKPTASGGLEDDSFAYARLSVGSADDVKAVLASAKVKIANKEEPQDLDESDGSESGGQHDTGFFSVFLLLMHSFF